MEEFCPPSTVEPLQPALNSHPGPVSGHGYELLQTAISGNPYPTSSRFVTRAVFRQTSDNADMPAPGRNSSGIMEESCPPSTVAPLQPPLISRPGPVSGLDAGLFQTAFLGKYNFVSRCLFADASAVSSLPSMLYRATVVLSSPSLQYPAPFSRSHQLLRRSSPGRTSQSRMEALDLPSSVVPVSDITNNIHTLAICDSCSSQCSCRQSRPGPESSSRDRVFQTASLGKYTCNNESSRPDVYHLSPKATSAPEISSPVLLYYQNVGGINSVLNEYPLACSDVSFDVYAFTETWFNEYTASTQLFDVSRLSFPDPSTACSLLSKSKCNVVHQKNCAEKVLIYYQNVGGINSVLNEYRLACSDASYDVYAFTETWLNNNTLSTQLFDSTYHVYRQDRSSCNSSKKLGGGVLLAVRSSYTSRLLEPPEYNSLEQVWVAITSSETTLYICVVYIPPDRVSDSTLIDKHQSSLNWIVSQMGPRDNLIIIGDFNLPEISWIHSHGYYVPNCTNSSIRPAAKILLDAYSIARLKQVNGIRNYNNRILDLCFISEELCYDSTVLYAPATLVKNCRHHPPLLVATTVRSLCPFRATAEKVYYDFRNANFSEMEDFLSGINWNEILLDLDANTAASTLSCILLYSVDQFVPKRMHQEPVKPEWSNAALKRLKRIKRSSLKKYSKRRNAATKALYNRANKQYKKLNDQLYRSYQSRLQHRLKSNPKSFWHFVNTQRKEFGLPSTMTNGFAEAETVIDIANFFRTQFSSVFSEEVLGPQDLVAAVDNIAPILNSGMQLHITSDMVIAAVKKIKPTTSCGPDGIPTVVIKRCLNSLAQPLATIFNLSLSSGVFPILWKHSFVFPVHKKGCKRTISNYRGIAALSSLSKLFEAIVLDFLVQNCSHIISSDQHGYMPKRSTTTNLSVFTSFVINEIERGKQVDAIYTDLSAAFDRMNHEIALAKYDRLGIDNNLLIWLRSYLVGRSMSVKIGDHVSEPFFVTSGVPQGSHLGPFLFLLYMNDVCSTLKCHKLAYADDIKLYSTVDKLDDCYFLQNELKVFAGWCRINRMTLNVCKCSAVTYGRKRTPLCYDYTLDGTSLTRDLSVKDLGVILDSQLNFRNHIDHIVSKASSSLGFLFRFAKNFKDVYCLKALYTSLVRPILEYSAVVWSPYYQNGVYRIEAVQRKFIRFALRNLRWRDRFNLPSYENRCMLINLDLLETRRNITKACFVADLLQGHIDCSSLLRLLNINTRNRNLRSYTFFNSEPSRTNYGLHEPVRSMCRVFNRCYNVFDFNVSRDVNRNRIRRALC